MRCAVDFDETKPLFDQNIHAWGEMQSLEEEPCYREEDIKSEAEKNFFKGFKFAYDEVCSIFDNFVGFGDMTETQSLELQNWMGGKMAEVLFSILDNEVDEDDRK